MSKISCHRNEI